MAYIRHLLEDANNIFEDINKLQREVRLREGQNYRAARTIERWFRGHVTRLRLSEKTRAATAIQAWWRSRQVRLKHMEETQLRYNQMMKEHYNRMACIIQARWRGYWCRKTTLYGEARKKYLNELKEVNKEMKLKLQDFKLAHEEMIEKECVEEFRKWISYMLFKLHHLIRTKQIPGIYSLRHTTNYSAIEQLLASLEMLQFMEDLKSARAKAALKQVMNYYKQNVERLKFTLPEYPRDDNQTSRLFDR